MSEEDYLRQRYSRAIQAIEEREAAITQMRRFTWFLFALLVGMSFLCGCLLAARYAHS